MTDRIAMTGGMLAFAAILMSIAVGIAYGIAAAIAALATGCIVVAIFTFIFGDDDTRDHDITKEIKIE